MSKYFITFGLCFPRYKQYCDIGMDYNRIYNIIGYILDKFFMTSTIYLADKLQAQSNFVWRGISGQLWANKNQTELTWFSSANGTSAEVQRLDSTTTPNKESSENVCSLVTILLHL